VLRNLSSAIYSYSTGHKVPVSSTPKIRILVHKSRQWIPIPDKLCAWSLRHV